MDPTNPRWEHSEQRRQRSATFWKIIVGAAGAAALSAVMVASCLDRDEARRDRERDQREPAVVQTTAVRTPTAYAPGAATAAPAVVGPSTSDSTGGVQAANTAATVTAPAAPTTIINNNTTVTSGEVASGAQPAFTPAQNTSTAATGTAGALGAPLTGGAATDAGAARTADGSPPGAAGSVQGRPDGGVTRDVRGNVNDPNNPGSNPQAPPMSAGAGRFNTEAPYWSASSFPTNPEAGAGPFTTERNTPGYGPYGAY